MQRSPGSALRRQEPLPDPALPTACGVTLLRAARGREEGEGQLGGSAAGFPSGGAGGMQLVFFSFSAFSPFCFLLPCFSFLFLSFSRSLFPFTFPFLFPFISYFLPLPSPAFHLLSVHTQSAHLQWTCLEKITYAGNKWLVLCFTALCS